MSPAYYGFGDRDVEESEYVKDDHVEEAGLRQAGPEPGDGGGEPVINAPYARFII